MRSDLLRLVHRCRPSSPSHPCRRVQQLLPHRRSGPIRHMYMPGLLLLVKKLHICYGHRNTNTRISPNLFNCCILRHFCALSNVQELILDRLGVPSFIPRIRRYLETSHPPSKVSTSEDPGGPVGRPYTSLDTSNTCKTSRSPTIGLAFRRNQLMFLPLSLLCGDGLVPCSRNHPVYFDSIEMRRCTDVLFLPGLLAELVRLYTGWSSKSVDLSANVLPFLET